MRVLSGDVHSHKNAATELGGALQRIQPTEHMEFVRLSVSRTTERVR
eukprot:CAMPEP_0203930956 /NCGR_PEP_ID=MMETSP0359-20131031/69617_1 /ASSEMBLY_ACC=CAM_ASM_000338 /TAXON_ID=268821 /ORGANISM="Scrippsiella Hangoei, Strain SHTV-5" /LENGTH=46 /DNA_ID= /DNA_START= /DNA_END= /DNA_ORIENTATION=